MDAEEIGLTTINEILDRLPECPLKFYRRSEFIWQLMYHPCEPHSRDLPIESAWYVCTLWFTGTYVELFDGDLTRNRRFAYIDHFLPDLPLILEVVRGFIDRKHGIHQEGVGIPAEEQI